MIIKLIILKSIKNSGISFLIIEINHEIYLFKGEDLINFIENNNRKSIPYEYIKSYGSEVKLKYNPTLNYLKALDKLYF